eukprot:7642173-Ditylum_brightwellii.AAC.1
MSRLLTRALLAAECKAFFNFTVFNFDDIFPLDMEYIKENQEVDDELKKMMQHKKTKHHFAK